MPLPSLHNLRRALKLARAGLERAQSKQVALREAEAVAKVAAEDAVAAYHSTYDAREAAYFAAQEAERRLTRAKEAAYSPLASDVDSRHLAETGAQAARLWDAHEEAIIKRDTAEKAARKAIRAYEEAKYQAFVFADVSWYEGRIEWAEQEIWRLKAYNGRC